MLVVDVVEDEDDTTVDDEGGGGTSTGGSTPAKASRSDVLLMPALECASAGVKHLVESSLMLADSTRRDGMTQTGGGFMRPIVAKESEFALFTVWGGLPSGPFSESLF